MRLRAVLRRSWSTQCGIGGSFFGIGIEHGKAAVNLGTLWRSAHIFDAAFIFTIGKRYTYQSSDVKKSWKSIPLLEFRDFDDFYAKLPRECQLVGIEITERAKALENFCPPEQAVYLLGAEDHGLSSRALEKCHMLVQIPGNDCLNVAVAGSIVMYDRVRQWTMRGKNAELPKWGSRRNGGAEVACRE